jgi:regulator of sigma E protease
MVTLLSFLAAIFLLVAVHELGHFATALWFGVKVERFSIGFGPKLWGWTSKRLGTEFVIALVPLGGYVKFLDERDGPVPDSERRSAFNVQPLRARAAIVAGGPAANLIFAIALYSVVNWWGVSQPAPVLGAPVVNSLAAQAGFVGGERVSAVAVVGGTLRTTTSFSDLQWELTRAAMDHNDIVVEFLRPQSQELQQLVIPVSTLQSTDGDDNVLRRIGLLTPQSKPQLGTLTPGGAADAAGLVAGDMVVRVDDALITDASQLRELIRLSAKGRGNPAAQRWQVKRGDDVLELQVQPRLESQAGIPIGRVGAFIGSAPEMVTVSFGLIEGIVRGGQRTLEVSWLSLQMMGKILIGEASLKNLSGPITIADYAGQSASMGGIQFMLFLALISVSLGVLNLLPLPMLDGGHLMYYLWESLTGKPVSDSWMEYLQRAGLVVLLMMMSVAIFNDVTRLLG